MTHRDDSDVDDYEDPYEGLADMERQLRVDAANGDAVAMMGLGGLMFAYDKHDEARTWFFRAAKHGDSAGMVWMAGLASRSGDLDAAQRWYTQAVNLDDVDAMIALGELTKRRDDFPTAENWFQRAVDCGHDEVMHQLELVVDSIEEAELSFRAEAENGDAAAMTKLGALLEHSLHRSEAQTWFTRAAELGDPQAMFKLGQSTWHGDKAASESWFRQAAEQGHVAAMNSLGALLGERDAREEAESWFRKAAEEGNPDGLCNMARIEVMRGDYGQAESRLRRAVAHDPVPAMRHLGFLMDETNRRDEAKTWLHRAAEAGDARAYFELGARLDPRGPEQDEAADWFRAAAAQGDVNAMNDLGMLLYDKGDDVNASAWLLEAAGCGHSGAQHHPLVSGPNRAFPERAGREARRQAAMRINTPAADEARYAS